MFLDQFKDFMIIVLIASAVLAGALGEVADTIAIVVIVVLNAVLGFTQEYRAEKAMEALKKMAASLATVIRDGVPAAIPAAQLVPGDIVHLEAGNVVPADLRLTEAAKLKVEEAALTGESVPSEKQTDALADAGPADRRPEEPGLQGDDRHLRPRHGRRRRHGDADRARQDRRDAPGRGGGEDPAAEAARRLRQETRARGPGDLRHRVRRSGCCAASRRC